MLARCNNCNGVIDLIKDRTLVAVKRKLVSLKREAKGKFKTRIAGEEIVGFKHRKGKCYL